MENENIFQWTDAYPNLEILSEDIINNHLYGLVDTERYVGVISINTIKSAEYTAVDWKDIEGNVAVIHRLAVRPAFQKQGYARKLMDFAEQYATDNAFTSIRLDTYSANNRSLQFYKKRNYIKRGEVFFPRRDLPFYCLEKQLT